MIIKLLLLGLLAAAGLVVLRGRRTALRLLMRRTLGLGTIVTGALAVLFPDTLTQVAGLVGVGRGTDLLVYLLCVAFLFVTIGLYLRLDEMHDRNVELARALAIVEARQRYGTDQRADGRAGGSVTPR